MYESDRKGEILKRYFKKNMAIRKSKLDNNNIVIAFIEKRLRS